MTNVHAKITTGIDIVQSVSADQGVDTFKAPADLTPLEFVSGSGTGEANKAFTDTRAIGASGSENLDLYGGLTDTQGNVLNFSAIKALEIRASEDNTNNVIVGSAATNVGWVGFFGDISDTIALRPGGRLLIADPGAGYAVTASTADILKVANSGSGSSVEYDIRIVGV
jgi:hypothetical protein